jgi:transcriptional regulator with XRE-family HTH domain
MYTKERLIRGEGYWMETIQQAIHEALLAYMEKHGLNQTELAGKLGFTRGYVSQLMNGNFNLSQRKIIQLLLKLDMVPDLRIRSMDSYLASLKANDVKLVALKDAEQRDLPVTEMELIAC